MPLYLIGLLFSPSTSSTTTTQQVQGRAVRPRQQPHQVQEQALRGKQQCGQYSPATAAAALPQLRALSEGSQWARKHGGYGHVRLRGGILKMQGGSMSYIEGSGDQVSTSPSSCHMHMCTYCNNHLMI